METRISILGAGTWGTALAILAARNGCQALLWGHEPEHIANLKLDNENKRFLPGFSFPENLSATDSIHDACRFSKLLLISVPSYAFKETLFKIKPCIQPGTRVAWATKGFNPDDSALLHQVAATMLPGDTPTAILSGPTFAREVALDLPTAVTIASTQQAFAEQLATILHSQNFRAYTSHDVIGVQVGGAVKNVLAIAAGIADGLGFGANTRAALITRGLQEITRLGVAMGGKPETFMGLAGLGDLILTCTDDQSRNRRFGLGLGRGEDRDTIIKRINQEIEGIAATKETMMLAQKYAVDMPIVEQTYKVLFEQLPPLAAVHNLLDRGKKAES